MLSVLYLPIINIVKFLSLTNFIGELCSGMTNHKRKYDEIIMLMTKDIGKRNEVRKEGL